MVRAADLKRPGAPGTFLLDTRSGEWFSADRGDYFMLDDSDTFPRGFVIARETRTIEVVR